MQLGYFGFDQRPGLCLFLQFSHKLLLLCSSYSISAFFVLMLIYHQQTGPGSFEGWEVLYTKTTVGA